MSSSPVTVPVALVLGAALAFSPSASAETLTLDRVLALVRAQAPELRAARARVEEARARLTAASPLFAENPRLSGGLGKRVQDATAAAHLELVQPLEIGGQRTARLAGARAASDATRADVAALTLSFEGEAARGFYRALAAEERRRIAEAGREGAARAAAALERRHQLGDVPVLDVNVARLALARAEANLHTSAASRMAAEADLRRLCGLPPDEPVAVTGDLRAPRRRAETELRTRLADKPELRALAAGAAEAEAEAALGRAARWPGLAIGAGYERDERADVVLGVINLELPLFARGQGLRAAGEARARRLGLEADATRTAALVAVQAGLAVYQEHAAAAATLAQALPLAEENAELARRSYEAGQRSLADWLVVRREALEARLSHVDLLLAAAEASVSLALAAGVSP